MGLKEQVGLDDAGSDAVDENAMRRASARHGFRKSDNPRLARGIVGVALECALMSHHRADVHDPPASASAHGEHCLLRAQKHRGEIGVEDAIPVLKARLENILGG